MNWKHLKILHDFYEQNISSIKKDWLKEPLFNQYDKFGYFNPDNFNEFQKIYANKHLDKYEQVYRFLEENSLSDTNFDIKDIEILIKIYNDREQIVETENISRKEISTNYFDSSKALKKSSKLYKAVLKILELSQLAEDENDLQYLWILHPTIETKAILLCENDNYIRTKPRHDYIEIWYAGGANTKKLQYAPKIKVPIFYLCDWDNNGLTIYQRIKQKYLPDIELIIPEEPIKFLQKDNNHWKSKIEQDLFNKQANKIINKLIANSLWIEEESIKFDINELIKKQTQYVL